MVVAMPLVEIRRAIRDEMRGMPPFALLRIIAVAIIATLQAFSQTPDPLALVRRAVALEKAAAQQELALAFRERVLSKELDSEGKVQKTTEKVHDVLMIEGSPQRVLLEENGKPVSSSEMEGQRDFLRRVIEVRKAEAPTERQKRIDAFTKRRAQFREAVEELPNAFTFRLIGEEPHHGRACYLLDAKPRPGYQPQNRFGKLFTHTHGRIWIDKSSGYWVRVEGNLRETVNLSWFFVQMQKDTRATAEQRSFPGAGWRMSDLWYRTALRVGLFAHYRADEKASYWGYELMSPAVLNRVFTESYPGSLSAPMP